MIQKEKTHGRLLRSQLFQRLKKIIDRDVNSVSSISIPQYLIWESSRSPTAIVLALSRFKNDPPVCWDRLPKLQRVFFNACARSAWTSPLEFFAARQYTSRRSVNLRRILPKHCPVIVTLLLCMVTQNHHRDPSPDCGSYYVSVASQT